MGTGFSGVGVCVVCCGTEVGAVVCGDSIGSVGSGLVCCGSGMGAMGREVERGMVDLEVACGGNMEGGVPGDAEGARMPAGHHRVEGGGGGAPAGHQRSGNEEVWLRYLHDDFASELCVAFCVGERHSSVAPSSVSSAGAALDTKSSAAENEFRHEGPAHQRVRGSLATHDKLLGES